MKYTLSRAFEALVLSTFMDTPQEWHAFVVGFCEVICPWPPLHKASQKNEKDIAAEYHYYVLGRALGILAWLTIGCTIKEVFFG
jgi:hypothetical protein